MKKKWLAFEAWDAEKQRYELKALKPGAFAYVLKPEKARGEVTHAICATCYQRRVNSPLQSNGEQQWFKHYWACPTCNTKVMASRNALAEPDAA